nr:DUF4113 domain-containing protein [Ideonella benzenivorans]
MIFVMTSPFRQRDRQYSRTVTVPLRRPTANTGLIVTSAVSGLKALYKAGYKFAKAGVMLVDLQAATVVQHELDLVGGLDPQGRPVKERDERARLMSAMDRVNERYGRGAISIASAGTAARAAERTWAMKQERRTPRYTTSWAEMPIARA